MTPPTPSYVFQLALLRHLRLCKAWSDFETVGACLALEMDPFGSPFWCDCLGVWLTGRE